jgi:hypothetical protein
MLLEAGDCGAVEEPYSCHPFGKLRASSERSEETSNSLGVGIAKIVRFAQNS